MNNYIKFLNHASVQISNGKKSILTDPWYFGNVFDNGWSLLYENDINKIENTLLETDFIWISHEHPDHFSIPFFKKFKDILIARNIKVIFQKTKDRRVIKFLNLNNIVTIELKQNSYYEIDKKFKLKIIKSDFYDSALIVKVNDKTIFNLNDCPIEDIKDIKNFKKKYGTCDVLLSQFSYAAWKGGEENRKWREDAAKNKLITILNQASILEANFVIPFASFIYFSNNINFYLNDSSNKIDDLIKLNKNNKINLIIMQPNEKQQIDKLVQDNQSIEFWKNIYKNPNTFKKFEFTKSIDEKEILQAFKKFQIRTFNTNSKLIMKLIYYIPKFNFFKKQYIYLYDLNKTVELDIFKNIKIKNYKSSQILMNSNTLFFLLNNSFGFDTLTINGCFQVNSFKTFGNMAKFFAVGNLNNLGIKINIFSFFNFKLLLLFFTRLRKVEYYLSE